MKQSTRIAKDMFDKCGALVSITDIAKYFGISANTARRIVAGVPPIVRARGNGISTKRSPRLWCDIKQTRKLNHYYIKLSANWYCEVPDHRWPDKPRYVWDGKAMVLRDKEEKNEQNQPGIFQRFDA